MTLIINLNFILCRFYRSDESASEHDSSDEIDSDTEGLGMQYIFIHYSIY